MFDITLMTDHFEYHGQCVDIESIAQLLLVHDNKIILYFYNPDFFCATNLTHGGATIHDENGAKTIIRSQHLYSET